MSPEYINITYNNNIYRMNSSMRISEEKLYCYFDYLNQRYPHLYYQGSKVPVHFLPLSFISKDSYLYSCDLGLDCFLIERRLEDLLKEILRENIISSPNILVGISLSDITPITYLIHMRESGSFEIYFASHFRSESNILDKEYLYLPRALDLMTPLGETFDIKAIFHIEPVAYKESLTLPHLMISLEYLIEHFPTSIPVSTRVVSDSQIQFTRSLPHFIEAYTPSVKKDISSDIFCRSRVKK